MKLNESILILVILIIIFVFLIKNKKSINKNIKENDNNKKVYYRNSQSVYNDDIYYNENENEYKKYRYNINNYILKRKLLKESEFIFYNILKSSINENHIICPKVKISNFIGMLDQRSWEDYYDKINYQSIDFLICDSYFKPIFGIILFYGNPNIKTENDEFLDEIYTSIKLPILKIELSKKHSTDIIKNQIQGLLNTLSAPESGGNY